MVMFKAKFRPLADRPLARAQAQQQQQPQARPRMQQQQQPQPVPPQPQVPPIEDERGPQHPIREPEPKSDPERVAVAA